MPDRDRLAELRRQRALIQEHLAWLEREIEAVSGNPSVPAKKIPAPAVATALVATALKAKSAAPADEPPIGAAAESILEEYRTPPQALHTDVRKGCFFYFAGALALVVIVTVILYFALRQP